MSDVTSGPEFNHCLICLSPITVPSPNSVNRNQPATGVSQNVEICRRFSTLVTRYIHFTSDCVQPEATLSNCQNPVSADKVKYLCDVCIPAAESFCQMYDVWFCLQLEMNRCLNEITQLRWSVVDGAEKESQPGKFSNAQSQFHNRTCCEAENKLNFRDALRQQGTLT